MHAVKTLAFIFWRLFPRNYFGYESVAKSSYLRRNMPDYDLYISLIRVLCKQVYKIVGYMGMKTNENVLWLIRHGKKSCNFDFLF